MTLMIVNDSEEDYCCKAREIVTTMIPDPMGLTGWYGDEQVSQVQREPPLDHVGFIPTPQLRVINPSLNLHSKLPGLIDKPTASKTDAERKSCSSVKTFDVSNTINTPSGAFVVDTGEVSPIIMQDVVSNHIILAIENCLIEGIKKENLKRNRHRAVYLDLTNSSSDSDHELNATSMILDTPSVCAKVKRKEQNIGTPIQPI